MHNVNLNEQNPLQIQPHQSMISVSNSPIFQFYASSVKIIITIICKLRTNKKNQQALNVNVYMMINLKIFSTHKKRKEKENRL